MKNLSYGVLLDYYGALLTERQRELLISYYNDDLSLSEISENTGISRQGVRDAIKRGESELDRFESSLGIASAQAERQREAESIYSELSELSECLSSEELKKRLLYAARRIIALSEK